MLSKSFSYSEQAKQKSPCLAHTVVLTGISHAPAHAPSSSSAILLPCALVSLSIKSDTPKLLP